MEKIEFIKMNGLGNDFVVFDVRVQPIENKEDLSKKVGDRHFGVGCDQIIFIEPPEDEKATAFMRIYNPDGSQSGACGNATRCVADLLMKESGQSQCIIQTKAGLLECSRAENEMISVDMGAARLDWQQIPLAQNCDTGNLPIGGGGVTHPVAVSMGNPHCVFFVDDIEAVDIATLGRKFEYDPIFPERSNIEFVEVLNRSHVRMRVWERGAGITLACGSGACATAVASVRRGLANRKVTVSMDGGDLHLEWRESDGHVIMTGPASWVFKGQML